MTREQQRHIEVWADWVELGKPLLMGELSAAPSRGREIFSFAYDQAWLNGASAQILDPALGLYAGVQYAPAGRDNFGIFLDSAPDRWGRVLMDRREAQQARASGRPERKLLESDYLLGVYDGQRQGALRFRKNAAGPFLDDNHKMASPPWTSLKDLAHASWCLEQAEAENDPCFSEWLRLLIAPGGSLGGARPKAGVRDHKDQLWIAKFPSRADTIDMGAWEAVVHSLAGKAGITTAEAQVKIFTGKQHTFLTKRFDRTLSGQRLHFASALTLLQRADGDDAGTGASYLELAEFIMQRGSRPERDLQQLWARIVFYICVSNVDDHLRNHGFILEPSGWRLAPAYDMNPDCHGNGLKLNISETDNAQDLALAEDVSEYFRVGRAERRETIQRITGVAKNWKNEAAVVGISNKEQAAMANAFRMAERSP